MGPVVTLMTSGMTDRQTRPRVPHTDHTLCHPPQTQTHSHTVWWISVKLFGMSGFDNVIKDTKHPVLSGSLAHAVWGGGVVVGGGFEFSL